MIAAWAENTRIIGFDGGIPFDVPEDRKHQKEITMGGTLIMGKDTYLSIPKHVRPLVGRESIVVSTTLKLQDVPGEDVKIVKTVEDALAEATREKIFFYGGEGIYRAGIKHATKIFGTIVAYHGQGDRFFPALTDEWKPVQEKTKNDFVMSKTGIPYLFADFVKGATGRISVSQDSPLGILGLNVIFKAGFAGPAFDLLDQRVFLAQGDKSIEVTFFDMTTTVHSTDQQYQHIADLLLKEW